MCLINTSLKSRTENFSLSLLVILIKLVLSSPIDLAVQTDHLRDYLQTTLVGVRVIHLFELV